MWAKIETILNKGQDWENGKEDLFQPIEGYEKKEKIQSYGQRSRDKDDGTTKMKKIQPWINYLEFEGVSMHYDIMSFDWWL